jgi:hypothetical protein
MKQVFTDKSLQLAFERTVEQYETFRKVVSKKVDCSDAKSIISHMSELTEVMTMGVTCKAQFHYLTEKLSFEKMMNLNNDDMGVTEKKIVIAYEIGDCSFYDSLCEMVIKESHYKMEILRSSLSFVKQEMNML